MPSLLNDSHDSDFPYSDRDDHDTGMASGSIPPSVGDDTSTNASSSTGIPSIADVPFITDVPFVTGTPTKTPDGEDGTTSTHADEVTDEPNDEVTSTHEDTAEDVTTPTHSAPSETTSETPDVEDDEAADETSPNTVSTAVAAMKRATRKTRHAIHNVWSAFTGLAFIRLITGLFLRFRPIWKKRPKFSYAFYTIVFTLLTTGEVIFLQWGMYSEPEYDDNSDVDSTTRILSSVAGQVAKFVSQMWLEHKYQFLLNAFVLALIYLVFIFITNRFWIATLLFGVVFTVYGTANSIKVNLRNEPIIPADLTFVTGGNSGKLLSFVPDEKQAFVGNVTLLTVCFVCLCLALFILDGRRCFIFCSWRRPFASLKNIAGTITRVLAAILSIVILCSYSWNLSIPGSWAYSFAGSLGYAPSLFDTKVDATANGPATTFLSLTKTKIMDKPADYSRDAMSKIAKKYAAEAKSINATRTNKLTDSTVILILSETFSDPTRVPGISLSTDPIPNIRALKEATTSGLMLSSGYGGGTANMEYQALTGLDLANFDDSLSVPFQQLVPNQKNPYAFNHIWNDRYGVSGSDAVHPYYQSMYLRNVDYKKFQFSHLRTLDSTPSIKHTDTIDYSPYVSDADAYQNVIDLLNKQKHPQFLQLSTMQNHMPYTGWYTNNEFTGADFSTDITSEERSNLETYAKGLNYTDQATASFLNSLNQLDKPVTVVFYGDHLPSIYSTASQNAANTLALHETDYFIWSNQASPSNGMKLDASTTAYTSPNYFMSLAATHMNAKVSPYLAMLTELHEQFAATSRVAANTNSIGAGDTTYLDNAGNQLSEKSLSKQAHQLLHDYRLVQYDMTAGKGYLNDSGFTTVK